LEGIKYFQEATLHTQLLALGLGALSFRAVHAESQALKLISDDLEPNRRQRIAEVIDHGLLADLVE